MMPSRGLRLSKAIAAPKLATQVQSRNISSHPLRNVLRQNATALRPSTFVHTSRGAGVVLLSGVRHASTTPSAPAPPPAAAPAPSSFPNLDTITLDNIVPDAIAAGATGPGQVGYLHALGIDTGYGPSTCVQWLLEHVHVYADVPWWGAILITAVGTRLALAPLFVRASDSTARSTALTSVTKPHQERMKELQRIGDSQGAWAEMRTMAAIRKRAGVSFTAQFVPPLLQAIVGYCGFKLMSRMAALPVPELVNGGFSWLTDLTATDGFLIVPAFMALSLHAMVRMGGETGSQQQLPNKMRLVMWYGLPGVSFAFMAFQPAAVVLWFAGTGLTGHVQGLILRQPRVREALGIAPLLKIDGAKSVWEEVGETMTGGGRTTRSEVGNLTTPSSPSASADAFDRFAEPAPRTTQGAFRYQAPRINTRDSPFSSSTEQSKVLNTTAVRKPVYPAQDGSVLAQVAEASKVVAEGGVPSGVAAAASAVSSDAAPSAIPTTKKGKPSTRRREAKAAGKK